MKKSMLVEIRSLLAGIAITVGQLAGALAADLLVPSECLTIQAAVDAASSGDTIRVAPGDYYEQTVIREKGTLTVAGEPGSVIHAYSGMTATFSPFVVMLGLVRSQALVSNLTFDGAGLADLYPNVFWGIILAERTGESRTALFGGFGARRRQTRVA